MYKITGKVFKKDEVKMIETKKGNAFKRQVIYLDQELVNHQTGEVYGHNYPSFEFSGKIVEDLEHVQIGMDVEVDFAVKGVKYTKDGEDKFFTTLSGIGIARANNSQSTIPSTPQNNSDDLPY